MKQIILLLVLAFSSSVYAISAPEAAQIDILDRAEGYCADKVGKKSPQFKACVNEAFNIGWNRYKEASLLQIAQERAMQEQILREQQYAAQVKAAKERREAEGWELLGKAAQMGAPVRYGTNCTSRQMVAGTWTTQCF